MNLPPHNYRGAAAMIVLQDRLLREFVATWRRAKAAGIRLPETDDADYESMESLLRHVLRAARGYLTWICEQLDLPDPEVIPAWETYEIEVKADGYLDHLADKWATPLAGITEEQMSDRTYLSRWGVSFTIDSMLEHAVVHPLRHTYQLENLMREQAGGN
ncbi:MAG: hypothetical protein FJY67_10375 [Calditrichaeota bacterium]|nr:hypothetical protein [Calditrichota bacterium]